MRIGELAALAGVSTRAIRHYHRIGLLPEPTRSANGYRRYGLRDAVRLLRVRRLTELGLSLHEVATVLADDEGRDLRKILTDLDADLARAQARLRARRRAVADLLAAAGHPLQSPEQQAVRAELEDAAGPDHPGLPRERLLLELLEPASGAGAPAVWDTYRRLLGDRALTERMLATSRRFEALVGLSPTDPEVDAVAAEAGGYGAAVWALLPDHVPDLRADPTALERLVAAVAADLDPAQARCLRLMVAQWQRAASR